MNLTLIAGWFMVFVFVLVEHSMKKEDHDDEDDIHSSPGSSINSAHSGILINSPASKSVNVS